jgi:hypothetical protein
VVVINPLQDIPYPTTFKEGNRQREQLIQEAGDQLEVYSEAKVQHQPPPYNIEARFTKDKNQLSEEEEYYKVQVAGPDAHIHDHFREKWQQVLDGGNRNYAQ